MWSTHTRCSCSLHYYAGTAKKRTRFKTFPKFLVVQMRKYVQDFETWQVNKLNCSVPLPEKLDLEAFRAYVPPAASPTGFMSLTHARCLFCTPARACRRVKPSCQAVQLRLPRRLWSLTPPL